MQSNNIDREFNDKWLDVLMLDFGNKNVSRRPSVILFTTFKNQPDRMFLQYNTIRNWASLRPFIQPVLFTTSQQGDGTDLLEETARDNGWHLYPAPAVNSKGLPFVRPMFEMVERRYNAVTFRGYSNGDLLFDGGLTRTLLAVAQHAFHINRSVIIGNHTVYAGSLLDEKNTLDKDHLSAMVATNGRFHANGSRGYAILSGPYPWQLFPGLAVGRRGLNNFIVNLAATHGAKVIDATKSLLAVHQPAAGDAASSAFAKDADFNVNAVVSVYGLANMTMVSKTPVHYRTTNDFLGNVHILNNPVVKPAAKVTNVMKKKVGTKIKTKLVNKDAIKQSKNNEIKGGTKNAMTRKHNKEQTNANIQGKEMKGKNKQLHINDHMMESKTIERIKLAKPPAMKNTHVYKTANIFGNKIRTKA